MFTKITKDDLKFMRLAINQARMSRHKRNRIHPEVGAVAVRDGKRLAWAYHGEKKRCDHAEYTLLEKKPGLDTLAGCTVYTTLEPCTTRNHPKSPCATRLIEHKVSRVVIGMLDPNQAITGKGILQLRHAGIAVDLFPAELMAELEALNREFIREHQRLSTFYKPAPLQFWEKRAKWWEDNMDFVINKSELLVVIDSYYGKMESFWHPLIERMKEDRPFHLIIMFRKRRDWFLQDIFKVSKGSLRDLDTDSRFIRDLKAACERKGSNAKKKFEFYRWNGISQGPLLVWREPGKKETIAMGLWQQVHGSTDLSPWFVTVEGPLFDSLKIHYQKILSDCRRQRVPGD